MAESQATDKGTSEVIPSNDANARFGELMQRAQHGGERFLVTRHGRPAAAIVPIADLERLRTLPVQSAA